MVYTISRSFCVLPQQTLSPFPNLQCILCIHGCGVAWLFRSVQLCILGSLLCSHVLDVVGTWGLRVVFVRESRARQPAPFRAPRQLLITSGQSESPRGRAFSFPMERVALFSKLRTQWSMYVKLLLTLLTAVAALEAIPEDHQVVETMVEQP